MCYRNQRVLRESSRERCAIVIIFNKGCDRGASIVHYTVHYSELCYRVGVYASHPLWCASNYKYPMGAKLYLVQIWLRFRNIIPNNSIFEALSMKLSNDYTLRAKASQNYDEPKKVSYIHLIQLNNYLFSNTSLHLHAIDWGGNEENCMFNNRTLWNNRLVYT